MQQTSIARDKGESLVNSTSLPLILFLMILVSCTTQKTELPTQISVTPTLTPLPTVEDVRSIGDGGLISGQPCASPCFFGIRIGETQFDQAVSMLESNDIYPCYQDTLSTILCGDSITIGASESTTIVDSIGYYPDIEVSIGELIFKYGAPNILHVIPTGTPEAPTIVMLLLFDTLKMRIRLSEIEGISYTVTTSSKIELINYFDDILYSEVAANMFSQSWKGYGTYMP